MSGGSDAGGGNPGGGAGPGGQTAGGGAGTGGAPPSCASCVTPMCGPEDAACAGDAVCFGCARSTATNTFHWSTTIPTTTGIADVNLGPEGTIYAGTPLAALDPDGKVLWTSSFSTGAPAVSADGTLFATIGGTAQGAISPNGQVLWTQPVSDAGGNPSVGPDGLVRVTAGGNDLALFGLDGTKIWTATSTGLGSSVDTTVGADGTAFVSLGQGFAKVSPDGAVSVGNLAVSFSTIIVDPQGTLLLATDNVILALAKDGTALWEVHIAGAKTLAVGADGTVYVGTAQGIAALSP